MISLKYIKLMSWILLLAVGASASVWLEGKIPKSEDYAFVNEKLPEVREEQHSENQYDAITHFKFVDKKPKPQASNGSQIGKTIPTCPFELVKVAPATSLEGSHFQLMHKKSGGKAWYKEGDELLEEDGANIKPVGKIKELIKVKKGEGMLYSVILTYNKAEFTLDLDVDKVVVLPTVSSKKLSLANSLKNPNVLYSFEGKKTGANSYTLNQDFFDAIKANQLSELEKIEQDGANPLKIVSLGKQSIFRKFGLKENDTLVSFGGKKIKSVQQVASVAGLWNLSKSRDAKFKVIRNGKEIQYNFKIANNAGKYKDKFKP